ncbi:MAG: hypothetical protein ACTHMC_01435 [Pseudobacter sp.]|uniref:hypothetical protein n=1 Tax=Pseudobacter sp. TaxID=2045420 RepID=UPI003F7D0DCD
MTLNQVIARIRSIILAHKQMRSFKFGPPSDALTDHTTKYPCALLQDTSGVLDIGGRVDTYGFRLFLLDLANVSEDAKLNELDVQSDMRSVAKDLLAEFNHQSFQDWKVSQSNATVLLREELDDLTAGIYFDLTFSTLWEPDACAVPTDSPIQTEDMKLVYDEKYVASGAEGKNLTIPAILGKKLLLVTRENQPIYKVSVNPDALEYTWDGTVIGLAVPVVAGERFLILYRNY